VVFGPLASSQAASAGPVRKAEAAATIARAAIFFGIMAGNSRAAARRLQQNFLTPP
jgi:hypothetical protein